MKDNVHEGHRQRLKNRFLENGLDNFEPHNILEMLLFYSIPRKDTNEIAHDLLKHFGSLKGVFDADFNELIKIKGITENSATLIKLIPEIAREYAINKYTNDNIFDNAFKIGEFWLDKFIGETNEVVYVMLLNNNFELLNVSKIHEGSINSAQASPRKIVDLVVKHNASMVILAHNHPDGVAYPSIDDIQTTNYLMASLDALDIIFLEHYVVARNEYFTIINSTDSLNQNNKNNRDFFRRSNFSFLEKDFREGFE